MGSKNIIGGSLGMIIAGFICALLGLALPFISSVFYGWLTLLPLALAIAGLVLSVVGGKAAKAAGQKSALATAGLVIGIIATVWASIAFISCGLCYICADALAASL